MRIHTVPCLSDNLSYLVIDDDSRTCIIIDPSEAAPFLETIRTQGLKLVAILATHHHYDHIGGLALLPEVPVWSSARDLERIPGAGHSKVRKVYDDAKITRWSELADDPALSRVSIQLRTKQIPGHTEGQVALIFNESHVFVGDTLFALGCGRCLEGTPEQLFDSLQTLKTMPPQARVYFGHEYTEKNTLFWIAHAKKSSDELQLDPEALKQILSEHANKRLPAEPPTLAEEIRRNPFLQIKNASEFRRWRELRNLF